MTPEQALKVIEAVRSLARHGPDEEEFHILPRDWARNRLEEAGLNYWPDTPVELEATAPAAVDEFAACRFPNCECNMNVPTPYHCEEYRGR